MIYGTEGYDLLVRERERERERSIKVLEAIVAYGAPPVAGNYIAPVTRYVGKTVGDGGGCCTRGAMATWGKTYAL